jgi:hypothetical protein
MYFGGIRIVVSSVVLVATEFERSALSNEVFVM